MTKKEKKTSEKDTKKLLQTIDELSNEKQELFDKLQRISADYANFQKRSTKQIAEAIAYEKEAVIKSLLPALDNFEHTLQNATAAEDAEIIIKGVRIVYDQMLDILKSHNVEQIDAADQAFDPALHQAMLQQSVPDKEDNIVLEVFQRGYKIDDKVIRPCKVVVNKIQAEQSEQNDEEEQPENEQVE
jgi:molecular chaperone GrpE